jgi:hypothetical protein
MTMAQFQQLQLLAQQGKLSPQQSQQLFAIRQHQERRMMVQRAAAAQQNAAPQVPAPQPPAVARPMQSAGSDSPSAAKKLKRERDTSEEVVLLDQRPAPQQSNQQLPVARTVQQSPQQSQFANKAIQGQRPNAAPSSTQQSPTVKQNPDQQQLDAKHAMEQKNMIAYLTKMLMDERGSHEGRPILQLQKEEKECLRQQLCEVNTKSMIQRMTQLLPMFVLLGGKAVDTRSLIRTVFPADLGHVSSFY